MKLPGLPYSGGSSRREQVAFGGINYAEDAQEGELRDSLGLSARNFPAISQRGGREQVYKCTTPNAVYAWGKLCVVDGTSLIYDGNQVGTVVSGPKQFAVVNTKLCIFPDKKYLDLENLKFESLDESLISATGTSSTFTDKSITMEPDAALKTQSENFLDFWNHYNPKVEQLNSYVKVCDAVSWDNDTKTWTLTGEREVLVLNAVGKYVMLRKTDISGAYVLNARVHYKDENTGVDREDKSYVDPDNRGIYALIKKVDTDNSGSGPGLVFLSHKVTYEVRNGASANRSFEGRIFPGDRVDISGCTVKPENNKEKVIVKAVSGRTLTFSDNTFVAATETVQVTIRRPVPDLSFICESDNRLWGCEGHTIYASALGDPTHFYDYDGLSTGSYAVAVGTDGAFSGCVAYSGNVLVWKEQCLHKVLGSYPAEYGVYTYDIDGVQEGSVNSMEIVNEVLYYKGRAGVYAYTGGTPILVSSALGNKHFDQAAGGSDGRRYYISMREMPSEKWGLYAYDIQNRLWLREDDARVSQFANLGGVLYALHTGGEVWKLEQDTGEVVAWSAELVPFRDGTMERKRTVRLSLRLELSAGATVAVETREDIGPWRRVWQSGNGRSRIFNIPLHPRRCDEFSVRISGKGKCIVRTLAREIQVGSGL